MKFYLGFLALIASLAIHSQNKDREKINEVYNFDKQSLVDLQNKGWKDITEISIPATAPKPSVKLIELDNLNTALQLKHTVSTSCGMYKPLNVADKYILEADIRIDNWSNSSRPFFTDWAIALGFFNVVEGIDFNGAPQVTFVAQPVSNNLVLYALRADANPNDFFNLEFPERLIKDIWYSFSIILYNKTGEIETKVIEKKSKKLIHKAITQIPNWNTKTSGYFQNFGFWDGEYNTDATTGNQISIDNLYLNTTNK